MSRSVIAAAAVAMAVLAGCGGGTEPSPPPTSEEALTTATAEPDVVEETTEPEPTTEEPEETDEAEGPPEMPEEAMEQTEAGAEAFALHYIDLVNYTGMYPETGLLEPLAAEDCQSCENHATTVEFSAEHGLTLDGPLWSPTTPEVVLVTTEEAVVRVPVEQHELVVRDSSGEGTETTEAGDYVLVFELDVADPWLIRGIQVEGR